MLAQVHQITLYLVVGQEHQRDHIVLRQAQHHKKMIYLELLSWEVVGILVDREGFRRHNSLSWCTGQLCATERPSQLPPDRAGARELLCELAQEHQATILVLVRELC